LTNKTYILKFALFSAFFLNAIFSVAQRDILELLPGSDKLIYDEKLKAQRLIGNVNFIYQGNKMYCDSAYFYDKTNEVKAYGKVHINKNDTLNLFCDSLYYNGKDKKAKLWGHVRVRDREYKITTDSMEYDSKRGYAVYRHGGKIENIVKKETLTSRVGYIYPDSKNFIFSGKVVYKTPELTMTTDTLRYQYLTKKVFFYGPTNIKSKESVITCSKGWYQTETEEAVLQKNAKIINESKIIKGDSLYYNPTKGIALGKGNISYIDSAEPYGFSSHYFYKNDITGKTILTNDAICKYKLEKDTLHIHADTLIAFSDTLKKFKEIQAFHGVKFYKQNMQGKSDSLSYVKSNNLMELFYQPIIWSQNAELNGEKMNVYMKDTIIDKIEITNKATSIMKIDTNYFNQIGGKKMFAYFTKGELVKVEVLGNSQTIYYPEEKKDLDTVYQIERSGMNRIYASDIKVYLDSGKVTGITYLSNPDIVFYPLNQINKEEQYIKYFQWNPLLRPTTIDDLLKD
jgi:lipopolysaccharide export system protein LptA